MSNIFYAKLYRGLEVETLEEHTENLLREVKRLKELYSETFNKLGLDDKFWNALELACIFHDLGKVSSHFQSKIKKRLNQTEEIPEGLDKEIPHNFLSGMFLFEESVFNLIGEEFFYVVLYAVLFHHDRTVNFNEEDLRKVFAKDLKGKLNLINDFSFIKNKNINLSNISEEVSQYVFGYLNNFSNLQKNKRKKEYILLKGFLHRVDHSASAHIPVENGKIENTEEKLISYLKKKTGKNENILKPFQQKAKELRDKSVILAASTGIGKTEFAINWIGEDKAFYTLPIRVSVNAMYDRFVEVFSKECIGLLHSDSIFYSLENTEKIEDILSIEEHIFRTQTSKQLSMPITITTADQIFTSVFKYSGYEKIYATLMYSKVVVDEPQSYSPDTLAVIIKGLQEVAYYGGKFCVMSATIHPFIKNYIKDYAEELEPIFNQEQKHKITLKDKTIDELIDEIISSFNQGKKVLVITNTVKKSQEMYETLKKQVDKVYLLHSLFVQKDRKNKEDKIKNPTEPVIWISTQLVEASLDIDYDILFTEVATLDSLIQRMGRVYRKMGRTITSEDPANIVIATKEPSDKGRIYDGEIVKRTIDALKDFESKILLDEQKQNLINEVYNINQIKNTKFYKKFEKNMKLLDAGFEAENKSEAQQLFREILNLNVIPAKVFEENEKIITASINRVLDKTKNIVEKTEALYTLNKFSLSIPFYKLKDVGITQITPDEIRSNKIFT
ncbi:MAG: CRISPR-associated helicase Cas3', partial [Sulfurihydrogenibium sp.]